MSTKTETKKDAPSGTATPVAVATPISASSVPPSASSTPPPVSSVTSNGSPPSATPSLSNHSKDSPTSSTATSSSPNQKEKTPSATPQGQSPSSPNAAPQPSNVTPIATPSSSNATPSSAPDDEAMSYVHQEGDWKYRPINLMNVLRGFVRQLKPGQDLTKVSMPAEVCYPYGLLEVVGGRESAVFHLAFGMNNHPDSPLERFLSALRFFFGGVRSERFDKKPWNPVLGETHVAWTEVVYGEDGTANVETAPMATQPSIVTINDKNRSRNIFVSEQVSHHPPISAFCLWNSKEEMTCSANISFRVQFGGNYATVSTSGALQLVSQRFGETYELTKCVPDIAVRNVVWGKKYLMWEGDVTVTCAQTGYTAYFKFKEKNSTNVVKGYVLEGTNEEPLLEIKGVCGEIIYYNYYGRKEDKVLLNLKEEPVGRVRYLPTSKLTHLSSVGVWAAVNKAIIEDDITAADQEKKLIEQAQRERAAARRANNQEFAGTYFDMNAEGTWIFKNNFHLEKILKGNEPNPSIDPEISASEFEDAEDDVGQDHTMLDAHGNADQLLDVDGSPINSGDEQNYDEIPTASSSNALEAPHEKRRRGSTSGLPLRHIPGTVPTSASKKELKAEKKKAREEQKMVYKQVKQEQKKQQEQQKQTTSLTTGISMHNQVYAGFLKMRNALKKWKDRFIVLQPGRLIYFKSQADVAKEHCIGIVALHGCDVRPRPSKKDGACFKIYHLRQYPIYSKTGLKGETISSALLPVGADYCILRCEDSKQLAVWIEKIRSVIPDWEKNKTLIKSVAAEGYSDDEDDFSSESEAEMLTAVHDTSLGMTPAASSTNIANSSSVPLISNDQIVQQLEQLYKITRKLSTKHRKFAEGMDEFKNKTFPEAIAELRKGSSGNPFATAGSSNSGPSMPKNPFANKPPKAKGLVGKVKDYFISNPVAFFQAVIIIVLLVLLIHSYFSPPNSSTAASTSGQSYLTD